MRASRRVLATSYKCKRGPNFTLNNLPFWSAQQIGRCLFPAGRKRSDSESIQFTEGWKASLVANWICSLNEIGRVAKQGLCVTMVEL